MMRKSSSSRSANTGKQGEVNRNRARGNSNRDSEGGNSQNRKTPKQMQ